MKVNARFLYGLGVLVLGIGNVLFGAGQLVAGQQSSLIALVELVMGVTLVFLGYLVVTDSDRLATPSLSNRVLAVIGVVALLTGLFLALGGVGLLFFV